MVIVPLMKGGLAIMSWNLDACSPPLTETHRIPLTCFFSDASKKLFSKKNVTMVFDGRITDHWFTTQSGLILY
jgi:hypothetical protein